MLDFEVQRCTRRCCQTGRELTAGETFYSVLITEGTAVVRYDYGAEVWSGPPEGALGWWKAQMPEAQAKKMHWAPHEVMLHYFEQLEEQTGRQDVRYVLALLLLRRRILHWEEAETDEQGQELLVLFCPRNESHYRVPVVTPDPQRAVEIQQELAELLFADAQ